MDHEVAKAFAAHVRKLTELGCSCPDEDRRLDAIRSLGAMALLIEGWTPHDPDGGQEIESDEVVNLGAYRVALLRYAA